MGYTNNTGLVSTTQVFSPFLDWSKITPSVLQAACERGSRVHRAIEADLQGEFPMLPDGEKGYLAAARKFLDNVGEVILVEKRLTSDVYQFTGQVDLVCKMSGDERVTVLDWKTGSVLNKSWGLQAAAYAFLVKANAYPIGNDARCMTVRLKKNGTFTIDEYSNPAYLFSIFLNVLSSYKYFNPKRIDVDWGNL